MRIEYVRNLMASHMVLEQRAPLEDWEEAMIAHSQIEGVMFAETVMEDHASSLWYDITGKQALDVWLETRSLRYDLLCRLLTGLYDIIGRLDSFLLQPDAILLMPECIFLDHEAGAVYFCYYPGNVSGGGLPQAFREFMEYLLAKMDHRDERAVELGYQIYEQVGRDGFGLAALRELLRMDYDKEETPVEVEESPVEHGEEDGAEEELQMVKEKKLGHIWGGLSKQGRDAPEKSRGGLAEIATEIKRILLGRIAGWKKAGREEEQQEKFVFEPEEQPKEERSRPTVLLANLKREPDGILRYEGSGCIRDMRIEQVPFIIGSAPDCDGCIEKDTISRHHAKITKVDDIYFLEDLNSSNGTSVGGELLNYKVKISLQKNEVILFADEKFRFI